MKKLIKIILIVCCIGCGIFLDVFGFTTPLGHSISTICVLSGMVLFGGGIALLAWQLGLK